MITDLFKKVVLKLVPKDYLTRILSRSLQLAIKEQGLSPIYDQLGRIVPDLTDQYSSFKVNNEYLKLKVRGMHAFQVSLINEALKIVNESSPGRRGLTIVDIGDSAGSHLQYLKGLHPEQALRCLSVNLDKAAVERIRAKNLEAVCIRAEELASLSIKADIFLSFEMVEHLMNQCAFLYSLSSKTDCKLFVMTVPYVKNSRVGFSHIRRNEMKRMNPENLHIYELSPEDYRLLFKQCGWKPVVERIYYQYPRRSLFGRLLKRYWQKNDYEGFYGVILERDDAWSKLYDGWD